MIKTINFRYICLILLFICVASSDVFAQSEFGEHRTPVCAIAFSPDGKLKASRSIDGQLIVWDGGGHGIVYHREAFTSGTNQRRSVDFSSDGKYMAMDSGERVYLWEVGNWDERPSDKYLANTPIHIVRFSPDSKMLAIADRRSVRLWKVPSLDHVTDIGPNPANDLSFSNDNRYLAICAKDEPRVRIYEVDTWRFIELPPQEEEVLAVAFSPDKKFLAVSDREKIIIFNVPDANGDNALNPALWTIKKVINMEKYPFYSLAFSPGGKYLAAGTEYKIKIYDTQEWNEYKEVYGNGSIISMVFSSRAGTFGYNSSPSKQNEFTVCSWSELPPPNIKIEDIKSDESDPRMACIKLSLTYLDKVRLERDGVVVGEQSVVGKHNGSFNDNGLEYNKVYQYRAVGLKDGHEVHSDYQKYKSPLPPKEVNAFICLVGDWQLKGSKLNPVTEFLKPLWKTEYQEKFKKKLNIGVSPNLLLLDTASKYQGERNYLAELAKSSGLNLDNNKPVLAVIKSGGIKINEKKWCPTEPWSAVIIARLPEDNSLEQALQMFGNITEIKVREALDSLLEESVKKSQ